MDVNVYNDTFIKNIKFKIYQTASQAFSTELADNLPVKLKARERVGYELYKIANIFIHLTSSR